MSDHPQVDVRFTGDVTVVFVIDPAGLGEGEGMAAYADALKHALEANTPPLHLVGTWTSGMDPQGPPRYLDALGNDAYRITVGGTTTVEVGTPAEQVRELAEMHILAALNALPMLHVVGRYTGKPRADVRLQGSKDRSPHRAWFGFDEAFDDPSLWHEGFGYNETWNGWATPYFELEVALKVMAAHNPPPPAKGEEPNPFVGGLMTFDAERKVFHYRYDEEEVVTIEPETLMLPGETESRTVYDFGLGMCWSEEPWNDGQRPTKSPVTEGA
jgi:hypothetical protein